MAQTERGPVIELYQIRSGCLGDEVRIDFTVLIAIANSRSHLVQSRRLAADRAKRTALPGIAAKHDSKPTLGADQRPILIFRATCATAGRAATPARTSKRCRGQREFDPGM
jgi:hypothetical protein